MAPLIVTVAALVVDVRIGLAECTAPTVATTALIALALIASAGLEPLFDKPLELWIILVVIDLNDIGEVRNITIVALAEGTVGHQITVRVVLIYGDVLTGPLTRPKLSILSCSRLACWSPVSASLPSSAGGGQPPGLELKSWEENTLRGGDDEDEF